MNRNTVGNGARELFNACVLLAWEVEDRRALAKLRKMSEDR